MDREQLREYIETNLPRARRNRKLGLLAAHLLDSLVLTFLAWMIGLNLGATETEGGITAMIMLTVASLTGALMHGVSTALDLSPRSDRELRRQLLVRARMESLRDGLDEDLLQAEKVKKQKRAQDYRLTDDGELELIDPDAFAEAESDRTGRTHPKS